MGDGHEWAHRHFKSFRSATMEQEKFTPTEEEDTLLRDFSSQNLQTYERLNGPSRSDSKDESESWCHRMSHVWHKGLVSNGYRGLASCVKHVNSGAHDNLVGLLVVANAICIGLETDFQAQNPGQRMPAYLRGFEIFFCVTFSLDLIVRIGSNPFRFFDSKLSAFGWNIFDLCVVGLQLVDQLGHSGLMAAELSLLRALRLVRIIRLLRVVRFFEELRLLITSILDSMASLMWSLCLLSVLLYITGVAFCQAVHDAGNNGDLSEDNKRELHHWFGSLSRSILTMFEVIVGGVSWDEVISPLISDIGPLIGLVFCFYVALCVFAVLNTITGVIVQKVTSDALSTQAAHLANHLRELFFNDEASTLGINLEHFQEKIKHPDMQDYFKGIDVAPNEAQYLFSLLDIDGSGEVSPEEMVDGCLRLGRPAQALDLAVMMRELLDIKKLLKPPVAPVLRSL